MVRPPPTRCRVALCASLCAVAFFCPGSWRTACELAVYRLGGEVCFVVPIALLLRFCLWLAVIVLPLLLAYGLVRHRIALNRKSCALIFMGASLANLRDCGGSARWPSTFLLAVQERFERTSGPDEWLDWAKAELEPRPPESSGSFARSQLPAFVKDPFPGFMPMGIWCRSDRTGIREVDVSWHMRPWAWGVRVFVPRPTGTLALEPGGWWTQDPRFYHREWKPGLYLFISPDQY